jgi:hypothetical protein
VNTTVFGAGRSATTVTLFKVTLPVLRTTPLKLDAWPEIAVVAGQTSVIEMPGVVVIGHVVLAELVTGVPQRLFAFAVSVLVTEQFVGAGKLPENETASPGASEARVKMGVFGAG